MDNTNIFINIHISTKLLLRLSNILYLDKVFSGFFFIFPALSFIFFLIHLIICQSPRIHLACLVIKELYLYGYPSNSKISDASAHLK